MRRIISCIATLMILLLVSLPVAADPLWIPPDSTPKFAVLARTPNCLTVELSKTYNGSRISVGQAIEYLGYEPVYCPSTEADLRRTVRDKSVVCMAIFPKHSGGKQLQLHDNEYVSALWIEKWMDEVNRPMFDFMYVGGCKSIGFFQSNVAYEGIGTTKIVSSGMRDTWWTEFLWQRLQGLNVWEALKQANQEKDTNGIFVLSTHWEPEFDPMDYDLNHDGELSKSETLRAVSDYFNGDITKEQTLEVVALYFGELK